MKNAFYHYSDDLRGEGIVYPGHPLVLAHIIMALFPDYLAAAAKAEGSYSAALADSRVPGAGDHVGAALRVLKICHDNASLDAMVAEAHRYWTEGQAGGHLKAVEAGLAQAQAIEPAFRERAARWFGIRELPAAPSSSLTPQ